MNTINSIKTIAVVCAVSILGACTYKSATPCFTVDKGKTAKLNEEVQFDASCSTNSSAFAWDFGDSTVASGSNVKHKFTTAKKYIIKLTVGTGNSSVSTAQELEILP